MEEQGMPLVDPREPHSTRFKEVLLNLLPDWKAFCQVHEVYITTDKKVGDVLAEAHKTQLDQNDYPFYPFPFSGSFPRDSLTSLVPCQLKNFLNFLL